MGTVRRDTLMTTETWTKSLAPRILSKCQELKTLETKALFIELTKIKIFRKWAPKCISNLTQLLRLCKLTTTQTPSFTTLTLKYSTRLSLGKASVSLDLFLSSDHGKLWNVIWHGLRVMCGRCASQLLLTTPSLLTNTFWWIKTRPRWSGGRAASTESLI